MRQNGRKTTAKTTSSRGVAQVPQPNGGALNAGGTPGNRVGTGRPPNELVAISRCVCGLSRMGDAKDYRP
jgi:hypothetical protein